MNIQCVNKYLKYICESEFDLRESPDWLSQRKKVGSSSSVELHQRDLRLYGPQVRVMSTHNGMIGIVIIMIGVFVSNLTNNMIRSRDMRVSPGGRDQPPHGSLSCKLPAKRGDSACNWCKGESRTSSLGQFNSSRSMKDPPSKDRTFFSFP